ncbi:tail fiber protein [Sphingomonas sp. 4RDLI-65]|uniref:phage tail protein n=1 Tax=Sphingomonas sp. 4RDLI-65 TaxID=3111641 RepID=UPI003C147795
MSTPYIGEIRILPYARGAPENWQGCDGSLLSIAEYDVLYQLIGTTYGGDGQSTFAVPDLRSRVPLHQGKGAGLTPRTMGEVGGVETVTLTTQQMGQHFHVMQASTVVGTTASPANTVLGAVGGVAEEVLYATSPAPADGVAFPATMVKTGGGSQSHDNTAPTLTLRYCISLYGVFPSQS